MQWNPIRSKGETSPSVRASKLGAAVLALTMLTVSVLAASPMAPAQTSSPDIELNPLFPQENLTGLRTNQPVAWTNLTLTLEVDGSDAGDIVEVRMYPQGPDGPFREAKLDDNGDWWSYYNYRTYDTDDYEIVYEAETSGGTVLETSHIVNVRRNVPPEAEISSPSDNLIVEADSSAGATIPLRGHADDPDPVRQPVDSDYEWSLPSIGESLIGPYHHVDLPVGFNDVTLTVYDAYRESGELTVTVGVDDFITASGILTRADGQTDDGVYLIDPTQHTFEEIQGIVDVDHYDGSGATSAIVDAEVVYFGTRANSMGAVVGTFNGTADANGEVLFSYEHDLTGHLDRGESIASYPGYHQIQMDITADSAPGAPQGEETTSLVIEYWIQPGEPLLG